MNALWNNSIFAVVDEPDDLTSSITLLGYVKGGGQADIRKARLETKDGYRIVVVKQFRHTAEATQLANNEIRIWLKASGHANVVKLLGITIGTGAVPSMVSEFCERGDLLSYTFNAARSNHRNLLSDILEGLAHIHRLKLAHGDLKPENVVLTTHLERLTAKICDFGSARDLSSQRHTPLEYTCTTLYRSPELSIDEDLAPNPSSAADVWAFGCILFVVLCKKLPYHWVRNKWIIDSFIASKKPPHSESDKWAEASLKDIALSCWMDVPLRPSAATLLKSVKNSEIETYVPIDISTYKDIDASGMDWRVPGVPAPLSAPIRVTPPDSSTLQETEERAHPYKKQLDIRTKLYPYEATYTTLRRAFYSGKSVIVKSIRGLDTEYSKPAGAVYLHYKADMFELRHPNLVHIYGYLPNPDGGLIMEPYFGNLLEHIGFMNHQARLRAFCEILQGLESLHNSEPPIAHQCLKTSNIMFNGARSVRHGLSLSVKLGLMNSEPYLAFASEPPLTRSYSPSWPIVSRWWSPEVFEDRTGILTVENDVWAFGCVVLEALTGSLPYPGFEEGGDLVSFIRAGHLPDTGVLQIPQLKLWEDVRRCWVTPRPTTTSMLDIFCGHLVREIMQDVPDLTGQVEWAPQPFVQGHSSDIYSGVYTIVEGNSPKISVIVKHVRPNNMVQGVQSFRWLQECAKNRRFYEHENICSLLGTMYSTSLGPLLVLECYTGGNLSEYMRIHGDELRMGSKVRIMSDILGALVYVAQECKPGRERLQGWWDLHPGNILLDSNGSARLCGLGPYRRPSWDSLNDLAVLRYYSYEHLGHADNWAPSGWHHKDDSGDIWSFGCLVLKILSGLDPHHKIKTAYGINQAITTAQRPYEEIDCDCPPLWNMAITCWAEYRYQRPAARDLMVQMGKIKEGLL